MMNQECFEFVEYKICKELFNIYMVFIWCLCTKKSTPFLVLNQPTIKPILQCQFNCKSLPKI